MKTFLILGCLWFVVGCSTATQNQAAVRSTTTQAIDSQRQRGQTNLTREQAIIFRQELARLETILNEDEDEASQRVTSQQKLLLQEVRRQEAIRATRIKFALWMAQRAGSVEVQLEAARQEALRQEAYRAKYGGAAQPTVTRQEAQQHEVLRQEAMQVIHNEARLGADLEAVLEATQPVVSKQEAARLRHE